MWVSDTIHAHAQKHTILPRYIVVEHVQCSAGVGNCLRYQPTQKLTVLHNFGFLYDSINIGIAFV